MALKSLLGILTDISAHSPLNFIKNGLVRSIKARLESIAVAMPVLMAYLRSGSRKRVPRAQNVCLMRPVQESVDKGGR